MTAERKPGPKDFPRMFTLREARRIFRSGRRQFTACPVCRLAIDPRNRERHRKACARRKRLAPDLWAEWHADMLDLPADHPSRPASDPLGRRAS